MRPDTDHVLILRSIEDPGYFEVIFDRYFTRVYRYVRRRLGTELAEDLAAEAFTQAFRSRQRFDGREPSALPWLYGITANLIRMHRRNEERRLRAYSRVTTHDADAYSVVIDDLDARLDAKSLAPAIAASLAALS